MYHHERNYSWYAIKGQFRYRIGKNNIYGYKHYTRLKLSSYLERPWNNVMKLNYISGTSITRFLI